MVGLAITLLLGFFLRIIGFSWDQGLHLHPDERMLIMVADKIQLFGQLNPHFFNYGSLPIYLVSIVTAVVRMLTPINFSNYDLMLYVGRGLSLCADLLTIVVVYAMGKKLFRNNAVGIYGSLLYSLCFFAIQNTHFFIVDTFLSLFMLLSVYFLVCYITRSTMLNVFYIGLFAAAAVTTKFTAVLLLPMLMGSVLFLQMRRNRARITSMALPHLAVLVGTLCLFTFLFMPYAILDWKSYFHDITQQLQLNSDPYAFPYTLQYVSTVPYLYHLKQMVIWGLGPIISILGILGALIRLRQKGKVEWLAVSLVMAIYGLFFLIIGRSSVKFMRYMLPIYPIITVFGGYALATIHHWHRTDRRGSVLVALILSLSFFWTLSFNAIYLSPHTRISATRWILETIPKGATIAVEHWDDRLPLMNSEQYHIEELQLYNQPDDEMKWRQIGSQLARTQYIIIASNRLTTPLQRLVDCQKYRACYPRTAMYYQRLFSGKMSFKLVRTFSVSPTLFPFGIPMMINDQGADESFTVYDHPTIYIFKKL